MAFVNIKPVPAGYLTLPRRLWPHHPPIFDGEPTRADRDLARELWAALPPESQDWYRSVSWLVEPAKPAPKTRSKRKPTGRTS